jgi:hypothetical protein
MQPINLLLSISIQDGIKVVLEAIFEWADSLVSPGSIEVPDQVWQHFRDLAQTPKKEEIDNWTKEKFREELIGCFYTRIYDRRIDEVRTRIKQTPREYDELELKKQAHMLASLAGTLSISQALDFFEGLVVQWVTSCDWDVLRSFVEFQYLVDERWTEQKYSEFVLHHISVLIER